MFEKHFGLRENPFHSGHQLRFLYPSREHQEARAHLRYGIENREPFVLITGEVGTGKTTALYDALAEWGTKVAVALITNSALSRQELIEEICLRFGLNVPPGASKPQSLSQLERHLTSVRSRSEYAVLLLDEAQNLAPELLEEIRLLSNLEIQGERLLQIFLVGQPELEAQLAAPQLRQLRQRISVHYRLNPLSPEETGAYIHHRISVAGGNPWATFPPESCREVYRITHGIPREINTVASAALIAAFSEGATTVQPSHVHAITRESDFRSVLSGPQPETRTIAPRWEQPAPPPVADASAPEPFQVPPAPIAAPQAPIVPALRPEPGPAPPAPQPQPAVTWDPENVPEPEAPPADVVPSAPQPVRMEPRAESVPAWSPPELGEAEPAPPAPTPPSPPSEPAPIAAARQESDEPDAGYKEAARVVDAWTAAAQELMEARRRNASPEPARIEVVGAPAEPPSVPRSEPEPPPAYEPEPEPPAPEHFPSPAELFALAEKAKPDNADLSGLPMRLREKIAADIAAEEAQDAGKRRVVPFLLAAVIVAAVGVGAVMLQKFQVIDVPALRGLAGKHATTETVAPTTATPATSGTTTPEVSTVPAVPPPAAADSTRHRALAGLRDAPNRSTASRPAPPPPAPAPTPTSNAPTAHANVPPVSATPAPTTSTLARPATPAPVTASATTHATPPGLAHATPPATTHATPPALAHATPPALAHATPPAPAHVPTPKPAVASKDSTIYGLGVAAYLDRDRADQERVRLAAASGLPATIVPFNDAGTTKFRVVLGHYPSNAAAEDAAMDVLEKYRVSEARPLLLSRKKAH